jgi:hypothetical protein
VGDWDQAVNEKIKDNDNTLSIAEPLECVVSNMETPLG